MMHDHAVAYILTLVCESDDVEAAQAIMAGVAEGFALLDDEADPDAAE